MSTRLKVPWGAGGPLVMAVVRLVAMPCAGAAAGSLRVDTLLCEGRADPLGIDAPQPRLSWTLHSRQRDQTQTAYQVLVASRAARLDADQADLWDSGKVLSDQSVLVPYAGRPLASHAECFWKVRVWDAPGRPSAWSKPARWTMGLLEPADWRGARWIGLNGEDRTNWLAGTSWIWFPVGNPAQAAPPGTNWFRRLVTLPAGRKIASAIFQYTGDNECRGWLNDRDLGARNNPRTVKWNDLTTRLEPGRTYVFGLTGRNTGTNKPAGVVGLLEIHFDSGPPLILPTDASWKVSDRAEQGWNTPGFDDSAWQASQVLGPVGMPPWGGVRTAEDRRLPARWLRKEFTVEKPIRRAVVYFSGLGSSELWLNGAKVGDAVLSPALSQYDQRVFYVTHDVTRPLRRGANALGAVLGGGRFCSDRSQVYAGTINFGWPKMILLLRLEYADGSVREIVSDASWLLTTDGPIRTSGEFDGEDCDARRELRRWSEPCYAAAPVARVSNQPKRRAPSVRAAHSREQPAGWQPARLVAPPAGRLVAQMVEPIRVTQTVQPVALTEPKPGVFIFDMGQNLVGWCQIKVRGPAGTTVRLRHAETVRPDGTLDMANLRGARATDTYTLKGRGTEVFEPRFTYHGFRYVELTGLPGRPTLDTLRARVVHDDLPPTGAFACSQPLLNRIYRNVVWGTRGNYRSIPTDCPQRDERQGWLGDRSEECRGETYLYDISRLYAKWLQDIADAQRPGGSVPDVAPAYWPIYSDNVTWPSTLVIAPGLLHRQYADPAPIKRAYGPAVRWLDYMAGFLTNGLIARDSYGDWCVPPEDPALIHSRDPARKTDPVLIATAYFYHDHRLLERYARVLGREADAQRFAKRAEEIKAAFNARFLDRQRGQYDNGTQTSCVLPLAFGLVPEDQRPRVFDCLVRNLTEVTRGHIGTGLIGGQHLMRVLSDHGRADLAYTLATQPDYPGWGYMVNQGATTIWELWNGDTADPAMNSANHVMLVGDLVIWLYEYLAGIAADPDQPGFKHVVMKPHPVGDLTWVRASHCSPHGLVRSEWRRDGERFDWRIEVPANTTATVHVPARDAAPVTEGRRPATEAPGVEFVKAEAGRVVFRVGSGKYHFISP